MTGSIKSGSNRLKGHSKNALSYSKKKQRKMQWISIKVATFRNNKKKDWFSHETGLVSVHGEIFKAGSRNCATFKMELLATIGNGRMLQRASSDGLTTNCLLKFAEHLSCQAHPDARIYKKICLHSIKDYMIISTYQ